MPAYMLGTDIQTEFSVGHFIRDLQAYNLDKYEN